MTKYRFCVLEDDPKQFDGILDLFTEWDRNSVYLENNPEKLKEYLLNTQSSPFELILSDICLIQSDDLEILESAHLNLQRMSELAKISGIQFISWLRNRFSNIPLIATSAYWNENLPALGQHAAGFLYKNDIITETAFSKALIRIAMKTIIGLFFNNMPTNEITKRIYKIIQEVNSIQYSFYFQLATDQQELLDIPVEVIAPQLEFSKLEPRHCLSLFETWCKRIFSVLIDSNFEERDDINNPVIPFGRLSVNKYTCDTVKSVEYLGNEFLESYIIKELVKCIYMTYYPITIHRISNERCLFNETRFIDPIGNGSEPLCSRCREIIDNSEKRTFFNNSQKLAIQKLLTLYNEYLI